MKDKVIAKHTTHTQTSRDRIATWWQQVCRRRQAQSDCHLGTVGGDVCQLRFWPSTAVEEGRQREVVLLLVRRPLKSSPENHNTVFQ